jgi:hypothetical protein
LGEEKAAVVYRKNPAAMYSLKKPMLFQLNSKNNQWEFPTD